MKLCSWKNFEKDMEEIIDRVRLCKKVIQPFYFLALTDDPISHKQCSEIYLKSITTKNSELGSITKRPRQEKIRIGYFSADFHNHPVALLTAELFEIHDRSQFEVYAFSLGKAADKDPMRQRLKVAFDQFIEAEDKTDLEVAKLSRSMRIDIGVDLSGFTANSRPGIFAYRAAPIQVNWLGYPGTMGADYIDYIVADKTIISESNQRAYTEKVVYLPDSYMVDDSKRIPSSRVFTRAECGLPETGFVYCCFNNDYKFNPQVLDCWSRILLAANNSVLWISENNEYFKTNITAEFKKRGINSNRIVFAKRVELMADHLARYVLADLFLDTHPYNAHTTAVDSLKMGVPVLTLMGQSFASRVAASLLNAIELPELITTSQGAYESLAIDLALNPQKLAGLKLKLANNRLTAPLFDTPLFTKNLEAAYIQIYERYQGGI